jgi:hypothetical protein
MCEVPASFERIFVFAFCSPMRPSVSIAAAATHQWSAPGRPRQKGTCLLLPARGHFYLALTPVRMAY